jgi:hypothetical protein
MSDILQREDKIAALNRELDDQKNLVRELLAQREERNQEIEKVGHAH